MRVVKERLGGNALILTRGEVGEHSTFHRASADRPAVLVFTLLENVGELRRLRQVRAHGELAERLKETCRPGVSVFIEGALVQWRVQKAGAPQYRDYIDIERIFPL